MFTILTPGARQRTSRRPWRSSRQSSTRTSTPGQKTNKLKDLRNLWKFVESFMNRTDISTLLEEKLKCETLIVVSKSKKNIKYKILILKYKI